MTYNIIGERERANLVVSTADFSLYIFIYIYIYIYISGAGRHHTVMFYAAPNFTNVSSILHISVFRLFCVYVIHIFRVLLPTTPGFRNSWKTNAVALEPSKQTTEVSTLIQTVGIKLIQDSGLRMS